MGQLEHDVYGNSDRPPDRNVGLAGLHGFAGLSEDSAPFYSRLSELWGRCQEEINKAFFVKRIQDAQSLREDIIERDGLTGYRLTAAESDGLPGITIDKYQDYLVCQLLSAGAEFNKSVLVESLIECFPDCNSTGSPFFGPVNLRALFTFSRLWH